MAEAEGRGQDTKNEERLAARLVLDVVPDRIREEQSGLEIHLGQYQSQDDRRVRRFSDAVEVRGDAQLGERDGSRAYPLGAVDAEGDGEGVETHLAVALDGLEVVDDGDP